MFESLKKKFSRTSEKLEEELIEEAEKDRENFKNKGASPERNTRVFTDSEYNYDEIEKMMNDKL